MARRSEPNEVRRQIAARSKKIKEPQKEDRKSIGKYKTQVYLSRVVLQRLVIGSIDRILTSGTKVSSDDDNQDSRHVEAEGPTGCGLED